MRNVISLGAYSLILTALLYQGVLADWFEDVEIISSNSQELIFSWQPDSRALTEDDTTRIYPGRGARTESRSWVRLFHLLLPAHQLPAVTILEFRTTVPKTPDLHVINHSWLEKPRLLQTGEHSLLELEIYPVRRQGNAIEQLTSITVRVVFPTPALAAGLSLGDISWLQKYTLNPERAGSWLTRRLSAPLNRAIVLSGDQLLRFPVNTTGVYQLTREMLSEHADVDQLSFHNIHIYGNDGRQLPEELASIPDTILYDLPLIYNNDDGDELFEAGESILFFGSATKGWQWDDASVSHYANLYTDTNYYWVVLGGGNQAPQMAELSPANGTPLSQGEFHHFVEEELYILRHSPYYSVGDELPGSGSWINSWSTPALASDDELSVTVRIHHDDGPRAWMRLVIADDTLATFPCTGIMTRTEEWTGGFPAGEVSLQLLSSLDSPMDSPRNYLQYMEVHYPANFEFFSDQVFYTTFEQTGEQSYSFVPQDNKLILDITDPLQPRFTYDDQFSVAHSGRSRFFLGARESAWLEVTNLVPFDEQDHQLPSTEFIIIAPTVYHNSLMDFVDHKVASGFSTQLVTLDEVLNSCSGGRMDPVAIRNFLYNQYHTHGLQLKYLLLVGNGHFDYRNLSGSSFPVTMPMYYNQYEIYGQPFPRDDYYVQFSDFVDVTVSRWQCYTAADVQVQIDKVLQLETAETSEDWRNRVILVADDERRLRGEIRDSEHRHTHNAEELVTDFLPPEFEISRIYSAAFPGEFNSGNGLYEKPACETALINSLNEGSWLVSFQGHGNNQVWTDERIFTPAHESLLHNEYHLPVFVAATCNWAEIDQTHGAAFSTQLMNKPDGGAAGIIAATNLTSGTSNPDFTDAFYGCVMDHYFAGDFSSPALCLKESKNLSPGDSNRMLYISQGDPTHSWDYPEYSTLAGAIQDWNGEDCDTLLSMGVYHVLAQTVSRVDSSQQLFNGEAKLQVFDANRESILHLAYVNNPDSVVIHEDGNLLFRGRYTIEQSAINGGFIVPRDISQSSEPASMRFFYNAGDNRYGNGYRSGFYLAATDSLSDDVTGPEADIRFNSPQWHPGEGVGRSFVVLLMAEDESGINLTGEIGHKIELTIDNDQPIDVTQDFSYDLDSWQSGRVEFLINFLEPGVHTITARIWDNLNNPTLIEQDFRVVDSEQQRLLDVVNYPNPFSTETRFTFLVEGLIEDAPLDVTVRVFTLNGRNVFRREYFALQSEAGFVVTPAWDGRSTHGDQLANGVYFYQVAVELPPFSYNIVNELGQLESISSGAQRLTTISKLIIGR